MKIQTQADEIWKEEIIHEKVDKMELKAATMSMANMMIERNNIADTRKIF